MIKYPIRFVIITGISIILGLWMGSVFSTDLSLKDVLIRTVIIGIFFSILIVKIVWHLVKEEFKIKNETKN